MSIAFRIDDLGLANEKYTALTDILIKYHFKHSVAAIPNEINETITNAEHELCEIWQHGFAHHNHSSDKKSEYPDSRNRKNIKDELLKGRKILEQKFKNFSNGFIPPWNRISDESLDLLAELNFQYYSADKLRETPLKQVHINFDLHTNKEKKYKKLKEIFEEMNNLKDENCIFMLHHNHMQNEDFLLFEQLCHHLYNEKHDCKWLSELA